MPLNPYKIVVDGYLVDFEGGVLLLGTLAPQDSRHDWAAEKLCRLSRDLTFSLGRPAEYEWAYIERIADTFDEAAALIRETTKEVIAYRDHIRFRAQTLRKEWKASPRPVVRPGVRPPRSPEGDSIAPTGSRRRGTTR